MRQVLVRGAAALVAILFVVGLLSPGRVMSGKASAADPDITITFRGLMVFDQLRGHVQVVELHSAADDHKVNVKVTGPDFPDGVDWGRNLSAGVRLQFDVLADPALPPSADWAPAIPELPAPFDIKKLHKSSEGVGNFQPKPGVFGPIFTFNAGIFNPKEPILHLDFVSLLSPRVVDEIVPTAVEAKIGTLGNGQVGYLIGTGLKPFPLRKPGKDPKTGKDEPKWNITVSNEPDYDHVCGYHFREYYKGFEYSRTGPIDPNSQYDAVLHTPSMGPCDRPHSQPLKLDEILTGKYKQTAIETRPCIPISY